MPVTFLDENSAFIILFLLFGAVSSTLILVAWYFDRRRKHRLAKWQEIGLTYQGSSWDALLGRGNLTGEYRGRSFTLSTERGYDPPLLFTRVQVGVRSPSGSHLTITPKWPSLGLGTWVDRIIAPQMHRVEDAYSIMSDSPDLGVRVLALSQIRAFLFSYPKSTIELKGNQLRFERQGTLSDPQDAVTLFDTMCDLAELIELNSNSPGDT